MQVLLLGAIIKTHNNLITGFKSHSIRSLSEKGPTWIISKEIKIKLRDDEKMSQNKPFLKTKERAWKDECTFLTRCPDVFTYNEQNKK